jgi:ribosome-associated toxin RatA of RatAB toxin-antitoxin module
MPRIVADAAPSRGDGRTDMTSIHRHALVRHSAARMFRLVNEVGEYPRRFPWCEGAHIFERTPDLMVVRMDLRLGGLRASLTTRNTLVEPTRISMQLVEGPFRDLKGHWAFHTLAEDACKVSLDLDFEAGGVLVGTALAIAFQSLADRMVDDFCREANRSDD